MLKISTIILTLFPIFLICGKVQADSLVPLYKLNLNIEHDSTDASYLFSRCSSLSLATYRVMGNNDNFTQNLRLYHKTLHAAFFVLASYAESRAHGSDTSNSEEISKLLASRVINLTEIYSKEMEINYLRSGSYFSSDLMTEDLRLCGELYQSNMR